MVMSRFRTIRRIIAADNKALANESVIGNGLHRLFVFKEYAEENGTLEVYWEVPCP